MCSAHETEKPRRPDRLSVKISEHRVAIFGEFIRGDSTNHPVIEMVLQTKSRLTVSNLSFRSKI